jgi:hypothetical protein
METIDLYYHIAENKLKMVQASGFSASFTTIWKGEFIHVFWNSLSNEIVQIWPQDVVEDEDMGTLNFMISNFYKVYVSNPLTNN